MVSAIVTESKFDDKPLFDDDLLDSNEIQDSILLGKFGATFANPDEFASDEENDGKLWLDIVQSIKQWQENKIRKLRRKLGLSR